MNGKELKKLRKKHGLLQADIAKVLDMSPNYISMVETGKRNLSKHAAICLKNALDKAACL